MLVYTRCGIERERERERGEGGGEGPGRTEEDIRKCFFFPLYSNSCRAPCSGMSYFGVTSKPVTLVSVMYASQLCAEIVATCHGIERVLKSCHLRRLSILIYSGVRRPQAPCARDF